ncbi:MAG TPA: tetratricopeptide repeat protein, partial [Thermoanaerobaculia bacterium]|nr:tetratricopeptide repeat protein [Thermoanaerobaculia bacterium]
FSLGVILNEMVSGMRPFDRQTAPDTMSAILRDEPRVAKSDLAPVIRRCLEKEPGRRFSSAKELGEALRARGASPVAHRISGWVFPAIVAVLIAAVALFSAREFRSHSAAPRHAIAVIPFGASEQEVYVSDGMTDAVIDALARVPKLRVMARSATERYRGGADPRKIADDLHVDALVTGRLRGNELDVELTAADGTHVWGSHYQADPAAPQQAQSRLIADLARQFGATAPRVRHSTDDPEAYRLYLRARYAWNKRDAASLRRSIDLYNQAIERDPSFALAYSGLADSWAVIGTFAEMPGSETFPKAKAAAMKAVELDDSIAEAHTSLAYAKHYWDHDWKGAEEEYRKAIALNPNYATAHQWYSELLTALGRFPQARQEIDRAIDLDPLSGIITSVKIWNLYMARDYAGAIAAGKQATSDFVEFGQAWAYLARAYSDGGDPRAAIATFDQAPKTASPIIEAWRAYAYAKAGQPAKTAEIAAKLEKLGTAMNPYYLAYPYAALGRKEEAIAALQRALEEHDEQLVWLKVDPALDSLRADPRFQKILTASRF